MFGFVQQKFAYFFGFKLLETNISHLKVDGKMNFLFHRWDVYPFQVNSDLHQFFPKVFVLGLSVTALLGFSVK